MSEPKILNLGIVAHVDAGKTTLTEQILLACGAIREAGSVDKGTAHTDFMAVERQRGISVKAASTTVSWRGVTMNWIDTPGHMDFVAEVERAVWVVDCVVFVVSAVEGIQSQSEVIWKALSACGKPIVFFLNKMDREIADAKAVFAELREKFSDRMVWFEDCDWENGALSDTVVEAVAADDEEMIEKYLLGTLEPEEIWEALRRQFEAGLIFPVLKGSASQSVGVVPLLDLLVSVAGTRRIDSELVSGVVFKIEHDKMAGRLAHVRLFSGTIKNRDVVRNVTQDWDEKVVQIRKNKLQKMVDVGVLDRGDIGVVCGFSRARLGDVIGSAQFVPAAYQMAAPLLRVQVLSAEEGVFPQLVAAMQELVAEDPLLAMQWVSEERELVIHITGLIQLEIIQSVVRERFGLEITFSEPSVVYKETPIASGFGFEAYTMPKPCWAILKFWIEPLPTGSGMVYESIVPEEKIMKRYQAQVRQAIPEALRQGPLGWNVTDLRITLVDGEHHLLHTHPLDFIVTTPMAVMNGLAAIGTTLLEPILDFRLTVEESLGSRMIGEVLAMRGVFDSPVINKGMFMLEGKVPAATSLDFPIRLASLSSGRGTYGTSFSGYAKCPLELGAMTPYRGVSPLDRAKYILHIRNAL